MTAWGHKDRLHSAQSISKVRCSERLVKEDVGAAYATYKDILGQWQIASQGTRKWNVFRVLFRPQYQSPNFLPAAWAHRRCSARYSNSAHPNLAMHLEEATEE